MHKPIISIIVPVYKAERYIRRCLDSIVCQTFSDWECILVDDGSPDNSGKICDDYAKNDKRFRVFHQKNEGVSVARQKGLDNSTGEYVIHTDSDDWVEKDFLKKMFERALLTDADMVMCDFNRIYKNRSILYCQKPTSFDCEDIINDLLKEKLWGITWNKLIKRECIVKYNISFIKEMNLWEDLYFNISLLLHNINVEYIPLPLYNYDSFTNENGIVMHRKKEHIVSTIIFVNRLEPLLSDKLFEDGWFNRKSKIKNWVFFQGIIDMDTREIFPEINSRFIKKYNNVMRKEYCVTLCCKGYPRIAKLVYFFHKGKEKIIH